MAVFAVLFVTAGLFFAYVYQPGAFMTALTVPSDLKSATFVTTTRTATILHRLSGFSFTKEALPGILISADERSPHSARVVLDAKGNYTLTVDGKNVYATTSPLAGVSVSPDGAKVAFAHGTTPLLPREMPQLIPSTSYDSRGWEVTVLSLATGAKVAVGKGSAPFFIDDTHLLHFAPGALFITDLQAQKHSFTLPGVFNRAPVSVLQSPDRTLVGWMNTVTKTITIYRTSPVGVEIVATVPYVGRGPYALGNDGLYSAHVSPLGGGVWKQGFTDKKPRQAGFLSSSYLITRIITGSL